MKKIILILISACVLNLSAQDTTAIAQDTTKVVKETPKIFSIAFAVVASTIFFNWLFIAANTARPEDF